MKAATAQLLGQQIGRIRVIDVLGEGGMGEVYVGFDDTLQRKVAVKVIRSEFRLQEEAKARFLREARILSRLDHPQVCTVYDFLEGDDCDFLVLELVDGRNLREAMESGLERDGCLSIARQLLEVLDAVHEEGVVHRDLKPENVMVASSGAITVLDFGLARSQEHEIAVDSSLPTLSPATSDSSPPAQRPSGSGRSVYVKTRLGSVMGTAGYMSPEQARGESATAASDMYATGLMLREMFTGVAPFTAAEEPTKILDGARTTPAQQTVDEVPGLPGLASLIRDLLRVEPVDRPSAKVALERLQWASAAPERRRAARRRLIAAVAGVVVIVAAIAGGLVLERHRRRCSGAEQRMEEVWSPSRRASVRSAVLASNPAARGTWAAVERLLDSYALAWQTSRLEACEATLVHGEQPVEIMNLRMACLDGCLAELDALVEVLNEDPATVLWRAVAATHALTAVDSCSDLQRLSPFMSDPDDPEAQEAADTLEAALARVKALHDAGRWADGLAELDAIQPELDALGWPRLSGEALYLRARCLERLGQIDDADQVLRETTWQSVSHRLDRVAANAWVRRVWVNGVLRSEFERAHELTGHAHAAIARLGGDPELEADLANHEGVVAARSGDMETALAHLQTALQIRRDLYGDDHPRVASTLNNVALVLEELGRLEESIRTSREVLEIRIRALGPDHPEVFGSLTNLAASLDTAGQTEEADALTQQALQMADEVFGPDHPAAAQLRTNVGLWLYRQGRGEEALAVLNQAVDTFTAALGADDLQTVRARHNRGLAHLQLVNLQQALGDCAWARDRYAELLGPESESVGLAEHCMAAALMEAERHEESIPLFRHALEVAREGGDSLDPDALRFDLVRALWNAGERDEARALASRIRLGPEPYPEVVEEYRAWRADVGL